jgi:enoyl-CoA hydratase/carnithine racemase
MAEPGVLYEADQKVGIVTLNRPDKLNALSMELRLELERVLRGADDDPATSVIVLRAQGRSFCVGFDIGGGQDRSQTPWRHDALKYHERLAVSLRALMTPWNLRKPVIASVQGHALGGGCELAIFCDLTIAADDAQFGEPEILFSQAGPGIVMPWIIGHKRARELLYFGELIDAQTALELRMINRVVPLGELRDATLKYAKRLALISPEALVATKRAINRGIEDAGFRNALQSGLDVVAPLYAATTEVGRQFDDIRAKDGLKAALKWRRDQFLEDEEKDEDELGATSRAPDVPSLDVPAGNIIEYPQGMAATETPMRVSWLDLEMAFQFVSGGENDEHQAYLCKRTGKLYCHSDFLGDDEEKLPDDIDDDDKYIGIPHKKELGLGKPLVLDFSRQFLPSDFEQVRQMFKRRGAYARFKDLLVHRRALDQWHQFEAKMEEKALRIWCEENAIEVGE